MKTEIREVKEMVDKVGGWLNDKEGELLYKLASNCTGKGVIVEIGSWVGKSTIWLSTGSKNGMKMKVYAIDPHTGPMHNRKLGQISTFEEFKINIRNAEIEDIVIPILKPSLEAARDFSEPVELIFIDGAHEYELVKIDFNLWFPKLIEYGTMAFHDTIGWSGPKRVVEELIYKSRNFKNVRLVGTTTFAQKVISNDMKDRLRNRYKLLLKKIYEISRFYFPKPIIKIIISLL